MKPLKKLILCSAAALTLALSAEPPRNLSYAIEDDAAILFEDETPACALSAGGNAYRLTFEGGTLVKERIPTIEK